MLYTAYKYTQSGNLSLSLSLARALSLPLVSLSLFLSLSSYHDDGVDAAEAYDGVDVCADAHDVSQETKRVFAVLLELRMRTGGEEKKRKEEVEGNKKRKERR